MEISDFSNSPQTRLAVHELINLISAMSYEKMATVSPASMNLKRFIKVPMIALICGTTFQSGFNTVVTKILDIFIQQGLCADHMGFTILILVSIFPSGFL